MRDMPNGRYTRRAQCVIRRNLATICLKLARRFPSASTHGRFSERIPCLALARACRSEIFLG
eukprot:3724214-Pyramimonas_sp.AAC.1